MSTQSYLNPALKAKNGVRLECVVVARISTEHQDLLALGDQEAKCRRFVCDNFDGAVEFRVIASRGSGEFLDRAELNLLEELIESRKCDLVIAEDLSRICRRRRAYDFCELCVDCDTRLIAINDRVDTSEDGWEDAAFISTWHHERSNRDSSDRIQRTLANRFDQGGVVQFIIFGYIKPPGAKNELDLKKDPAADSIIKEVFRRLEQGAYYAEIADWLNETGTSPGPYCRLSRWTGPMVRRFVHQTILKGMRVRNRRISKRINKTGRRRTVKAEPSQLRVRQCPHLAFVEPAYYDRVIRAADERNQTYRRTNNGQPDSRLGVSRKRTDFPGQHARCGLCGRFMYWHGMKNRRLMVCSGASNYQCWNSLYVNGKEISRRILSAVLEKLAALPEFNTVFGDMVRERASELEGQNIARRQKLVQEMKDVDGRLANIAATLEQRPDSTTLLARMDELEERQRCLKYELDELDLEPKLDIALPHASELRRHAIVSIQASATDDPETCRLLRRLIPEILIMPYQFIDERDIVARAEVTFTLTSLLPPALRNEPSAEVFTIRIVVDLEDPPQRVQNAAQALALKAQGMKERDIAVQLGISQSAVQASAKIGRLMKLHGLSEPYVRLTSIPHRTFKLRRHLHPRFRFEPLVGFPRQA